MNPTKTGEIISQLAKSRMTMDAKGVLIEQNTVCDRVNYTRLAQPATPIYNLRMRMSTPSSNPGHAPVTT